MTDIIGKWIKKYFSDPEGVILAILLVLGFAIIIFMGEMLAPLLAGVVLAYLLEGIVGLFERRNLARMKVVVVVFTVFLTVILFLAFGLLPLLSGQIAQLIEKLPDMISRGQQALMRLPEHYPGFISEEQVNQLFTEMGAGVRTLGQKVFSVSLASISGLVALLIYLVLVPVLVFFFLKDKHIIVLWFTNYLPKERGLVTRIWYEMDQQIGNYVRGKFVEIIIVGVATYVVFAIMGLQYAMLLGALVGLSVIIPYIGAAVVTVPVLLIAYFQFGWTAEFAYIMAAYGIIQAVDGNVIVPWLFSEAVNLHPVAIIAAVLVFGGIWGFWGVFFAIPLATLVKAVINAWPRSLSLEEAKSEGARSGSI